MPHGLLTSGAAVFRASYLDHRGAGPGETALDSAAPSREALRGTPLRGFGEMKGYPDKGDPRAPFRKKEASQVAPTRLFFRELKVCRSR
jgi:hypothetical protein